MSYSQNGEEAAILEYFACRATPGRFIDVGAYTGVELSNTRALAELGWTGVFVEPSPHAMAALQRNYAGRTGYDFICAALALHAGPILLHDCPDALSTTEPENVAKWAAAGTRFTPIWTHAITWEWLLNRFAGPFDFVNIDTEGTSMDLFFSFPVQAARPSVICVEHDGEANAKAMRSFTRTLGYSEIYFDGNNVLFGLDK